MTLAPQMKSEPHLSIAIFTRHRPNFVRSTVAELLKQATALSTEKKNIHIYVSDGSDDDKTMQVLNSLSAENPALHLRKATKAYDTHEEYVFDLLQEVEGKYVWTLSDTDLVFPNALGEILDLIGTHSPDLIVINPPIVSAVNAEVVHDHFVIRDRGRTSDNPDEVIVYRDLVKEIGLIHLVRASSAIVFSRRSLMETEWDKCFDISPIYAYAMAILSAFHDTPTIFTGRRIFGYRTDSSDSHDNRTRARMAEQRQVADSYFHTTALVRFLTRAVEAKQLSPSDIAEICEVNWNRKTAPLLRLLLEALCQKLDSDLSSGHSRHPLTPNELDIIESVSPFLPPMLLGKYDTCIRVARAIYPILGAESGDAAEEFRDVALEWRLFHDSEQKAISSSICAWAKSEIKRVRARAQ